MREFLNKIFEMNDKTEGTWHVHFARYDAHYLMHQGKNGSRPKDQHIRQQ